MPDPQIRFDDGAAYERMMGVWSRLVGERFLDWLAPPAGLAWIDVGCGNGAFTELIVDRCAPATVHGVDPSEGQLAFARKRPAARLATFDLGDAMALPSPDESRDAAVMALVVFFVSDPARAVAEMARVLRRGGVASAYAWDIPGGGFPLEPLYEDMQAMGLKIIRPPRSDASTIAALRALWTDAGFVDVETTDFAVRRTFANFDELWDVCTSSATLSAALTAMTPDAAADLRRRLRLRSPADADGRIACGARANAVKGRKPM